MKVDDRLNTALVPISSVIDVVTARRLGLEMAQALGFPLPEATKIAVTISELARNIVLYTGGKGTIHLVVVDTGHKKGIKIIAEDSGPGIENVDLVMQGGHSTSRGLGLGLSGSKRLMDEFKILSVVGKGTIITAIKWLV